MAKQPSGGVCSECKRILGTSLKYSHQGRVFCFDCFQKVQAQLLEDEKKRQELYDYIKKIFNISSISADILSSIDHLIKDGKKLSGIKATLYYYYEIMGSSTPLSSLYFVIRDHYDEAHDYFVKQHQVAEANAQVKINPSSVTITLDPKKLHEESSKKKFKYNIEEL